MAFDGSAQARLGLEAAAIAVHRQQWRASPTINFGRMPIGYVMSSANNAKLVAAGKRFVGGPCDVRNDSHENGAPPVGTLDRDVTARDWCGHAWCDWASLPSGLSVVPAAVGLYRMTHVGESKLVYVGEGNIATRIRDHLAKGSIEAHRQAQAFGDSRLAVSFVVLPSELHHHRLELETDLIGAHALAVGVPPVAQFLG